MNRKAFRNVIILVAVGMAGMSLIIYNMGKSKKAEAESLTFTQSGLEQELENVSRLSAALTTLDQMTIDENTSTQLNILRHLGLEQYDFDFSIINRQILQISSVNLYTRQVVLKTQIPYPATLKLLDQLYSTKKLQIQDIELKAPSENGNLVQMTLMGNIYGLDKKDMDTGDKP